MKESARIAKMASQPLTEQHKSKTSDRAFTRLDLVFTILTVTLCAILVLPLLANTKPRSEQVSCVNNLRQIGQGVRSWAVEHDNQNPWWVPASQGGTKPDSGVKAANVHNEFWWLRREFGTPKILACPSDSRIVCTNWDFFKNVLRNNAVSYFIGLHSYFDQPDTILSGDRNLATNPSFVGCAAGLNNARTIRAGEPTVGWTNGIHFPNGNLLLNSGEVQQCSQAGLSNALMRAVVSDNPAIHIVLQ